MKTHKLVKTGSSGFTQISIASSKTQVMAIVTVVGVLLSSLALAAATPRIVAEGTGTKPTIEVRGTTSEEVTSSELKQWREQMLLNNRDLEALLRYVNTDKNWKIGPALPKTFRYTSNRENLERLLVGDSNSAFGVRTDLRVLEGGRRLGSRNTACYVFRLAPNRDPMGPTSAALVCFRDLKSGKFWLRLVVGEYRDGNFLNLHEYGVHRGRVYRASLKKRQAFLLPAYAAISSATLGSFVTSTLPGLQRTHSVFDQARYFLVRDRNASFNSLLATSIGLRIASRESWWLKIQNRSLLRMIAAMDTHFSRLLVNSKRVLEPYDKAAVGIVLEIIDAMLGTIFVEPPFLFGAD